MSNGGTTESKAIFIDVEVAPQVAADPEVARKLAEVCPVDIFDQEDSGALAIVEENLDECVLCGLCIHVAPGKVRVHKLYDGTVLER